MAAMQDAHITHCSGKWKTASTIG